MCISSATATLPQCVQTLLALRNMLAYSTTAKNNWQLMRIKSELQKPLQSIFTVVGAS